VRRGFRVTLTVTPEPVRLPVRWAYSRKEVPDHDLWQLCFTRRIETVPDSWAYPRLVVADPPILPEPDAFGRLRASPPGSALPLPPPRKLLPTWARVYEAALEDIRSLDEEFSQVREAALEAAPRIGLLDPLRLLNDFFPGDNGLQPELRPHLAHPFVERKHKLRKGQHPVAEWRFVPFVNGFLVGGWRLQDTPQAWAAASLIIRFYVTLAELPDGCPLEEAFRTIGDAFDAILDGELWVNFLRGPGAFPKKFISSLLFPGLATKTLFHEAVFLAGAMPGNKLDKRALQERLLARGLGGVLLPGPALFVGAPAERDKAAPVYGGVGLAGSFHLALIEVAQGLGRKMKATKCAWCGRAFSAKRSTARYCSGACKVAAHRSRVSG